MCRPPPPSSIASCTMPRSSPSPAEATGSKTGPPSRPPRSRNTNPLANLWRTEHHAHDRPVLTRSSLDRFNALNDSFSTAWPPKRALNRVQVLPKVRPQDAPQEPLELQLHAGQSHVMQRMERFMAVSIGDTSLVRQSRPTSRPHQNTSTPGANRMETADCCMADSGPLHCHQS